MRSPRVSWWPGSVTTGGGLHIHHLVWGISLMLLSGPSSPWARRWYTGRRAGRFDRARRRFREDRRGAVLARRVQDLIGGTPSPELSGSGGPDPGRRPGDAT